jgi:rhamnosyltransferase
LTVKKSPPRFAVCLAAFDGQPYLSEQIDSILNQSNVFLQIYISVDKSSDGTENFLTDWAASDSRLSLLPLGLHFGGAGPNFYRLLRDVDFSNFDYLSFADQDDIWHKDKLWRAHSAMRDQGAGGYSSNVLAFWPNGRSLLINKAQAQKKWDFLFEAAGPGCTYVLRVDLALGLKQLIQSRWNDIQAVALHDWLSYAYARMNGFKWLIDPVVTMDYRQHASNQVGVNVGWSAFRYRARKVLDGWWLRQAGLIASLLDMNDLSFVRRWKGGGRLGLLYLVLNANHCRRRLRDQFLFALSCLMLALLGRSPKK